MKVLLVNGSPHKHGCTDAALQEAAGALRRQRIETETVWVGAGTVPGCIACGSCRSTGKCVFDDLVNQVAARLDEFDGFLFGTPVYYGGPSGQILSFMNRLFYSAGGKLAGKPAAAVVSCRRGGASAAFQQMNMHMLMTNMTVVPSQYWNQVHGNTPEEVAQDGEGLQTMRTLGENMAWLLRSIQAGKDAGIPQPRREPVIRTNFIR